ncbi:MAG: hypothetical protein OFPI_19800 [Osedax symbiont Rs2]|nr:MAG: hypothetical protein OFPI_19800 [Osedax symbiont Rs2]
MSRIIWPVTYLLSAICVLLLLWGGIETGHRLLNELWNIGHVAAFFVWTLLLGRISWCRKSSIAILVPVLLLLAVILGSVIEGLQWLRGSSFSFTDLFNDLTGAWLALTVIYYYRIESVKSGLLAMFGCGMLLLLLSLRSIAVTIYDEIQMHRSFPVLIDFQSPHQLHRILADAMQLVSAPDNDSLNVLKLDFDTSEYSGFALQHFIANWSQYDYLTLKIYRQQNAPVHINCRINDRQHDLQGYSYQDRFHRQYRLNHGWNFINISLQQVQNAPANRQLDLSQISNLGCFVLRQPINQTIYLHKISLY